MDQDYSTRAAPDIINCNFNMDYVFQVKIFLQ